MQPIKWGSRKGPFSGWGPIGYIPIDPAGNGKFYFSGRRAIPEEADHVWFHCVSYDFSNSLDIPVEIPAKYLIGTDEKTDMVRLSVLSDVHLNTKPGSFKRALHMAEGNIILLLGDTTHDGSSEQFDLACKCIQECSREKMIFCIPGNHDIMHASETGSNCSGIENYEIFQNRFLENNINMRYRVDRDPDSLAYAVQIEDIDLIGLQCVISKRKFLFPKGKQINWIENHLNSHQNEKTHIILCHAPLITHCAKIKETTPYLDRDRQLQELIDNCGKVIFLSGHTHISPNIPEGCGKYDEKNKNVYLDCGSVAGTISGCDKELMSADWTSGCITELSVSKEFIWIKMRSVETNLLFPRGCYRFSLRS